MKFTIDTQVFLKGLRLASVAMTSDLRSLPILGNIKLEAKESELILSSTNLDIYFVQKLSAKVAKPGATTAPYSILSQSVARMSASTVTISQGKTELEFKSGDFTAQIETLDAAEFPPPFEQDAKEKIECDAIDILKPFQLLAHAMSTDERRYNLMGINLLPDGDSTDFAATNAARLVTFRGVKISNSNVIAPSQFVQAVIKIEPEGPVSVIVSGGVITLSADAIQLSSKLIEGSYPNWKQVIPEQSESAFGCGRKPLIEALQTCAIFTERQLPALQIQGKGKEVEVSQPGKAVARILGTELTNQPKFAIRLNSRMLVETLSVFSQENVRLQCLDDHSPVLIEEGQLKAVIQRMRTA